MKRVIYLSAILVTIVLGCSQQNKIKMVNETSYVRPGLTAAMVLDECNMDKSKYLLVVNDQATAEMQMSILYSGKVHTKEAEDAVNSVVIMDINTSDLQHMIGTVGFIKVKDKWTLLHKELKPNAGYW
jgi:hypothetical protein